MRLLLVNPNTTVSMTEKAAEAARGAAPAGVEILARTSLSGPASIQGAEDGAAALPGLFAALRAGAAEGADAAIIACFDDTGLAEARALFPGPVLGIGQAAFHAAALSGHRFSVVTTLSVSIPVIEENLEAYGLAALCARVRASEVPVLALEELGGAAEAQVSAEIGRAVAEDGAGAIVLGCAGMADLADRLSAAHGVPVIDGVRAAVRLAHAMVGLGNGTG
ncbi:HyuE hydantoin racemase [Paroceanicella profunda]|uniref:HyuE hydantoin racemase n=1 Tax=Paroceanicella profunda TaxID=2579971 RepID=A0A5B8G074_9RHOB|nr:aspartate/glutamate racemase family protein [Paroceanicella profunda]QDL91883.1 HyuE hydantoin racemase [Paroceanicella profunda]